jgi:hypothetical protein
MAEVLTRFGEAQFSSVVQIIITPPESSLTKGRLGHFIRILCLIKYRAVMTYWGSGGVALRIQTSALDGGEWSDSRSGLLYSWEGLLYPFDRRLDELQSRSKCSKIIIIIIIIIITTTTTTTTISICTCKQ